MYEAVLGAGLSGAIRHLCRHISNGPSCYLITDIVYAIMDPRVATNKEPKMKAGSGSRWKTFWKSYNKNSLAVIALWILACLIFMAFMALSSRPTILRP